MIWKTIQELNNYERKRQIEKNHLFMNDFKPIRDRVKNKKLEVYF